MKVNDISLFFNLTKDGFLNIMHSTKYSEYYIDILLGLLIRVLIC